VEAHVDALSPEVFLTDELADSVNEGALDG
jgi:hypothetical protein